MIAAALKRLEYFIISIPPLLAAVDATTFSYKPQAGKWSKKEILGHLIDSATNNHHRLVRAQFEDTPIISYNQDKWNAFNFYQEMDKQQTIDFWLVYNKQLLALINNIPVENLNKKYKTSDGNVYNLTYLINDYVAHLEHHLRQIVNILE